MNCFDKSKWISYSEGLVSQKEAEKMENHLDVCNSCLEIYVEVIEEFQLENIDEDIVEKLTNNIMEEVESIDSIENINKDVENNKLKEARGSNNIKKEQRTKVKYYGKMKLKKLMTYYSIAACVTLVLCIGNGFNHIVSAVPETVALMEHSQENMESRIGEIIENTIRDSKFKVKPIINEIKTIIN